MVGTSSVQQSERAVTALAEPSSDDWNAMEGLMIDGCHRAGEIDGVGTVTSIEEHTDVLRTHGVG